MARNVEVLLIDDVLKLGDLGDIVTVRAGFARNYLFPQKKAIMASSAAKAQVAKLQAQAKLREADRETKAQLLKKEIDGLSLQIPAKVAHDDVLFGSIGVRDVIKALAASGIELDPRLVHMHESFKKLGAHKVVVKLHRNVEATLTIEIVNADPTGQMMDEVLADKAKAESEEVAAKPAKDDKKGDKKSDKKAKAEKADEPTNAKAEKAEAKPAKAEKPSKKDKKG